MASLWARPGKGRARAGQGRWPLAGVFDPTKWASNGEDHRKTIGKLWEHGGLMGFHINAIVIFFIEYHSDK